MIPAPYDFHNADEWQCTTRAGTSGKTGRDLKTFDL
jgi:hypothetical protein